MIYESNLIQLYFNGNGNRIFLIFGGYSILVLNKYLTVFFFF